MVTTGSKYFFGMAAFAVVAAVVYGMATYGHALDMNSFLGSITLGYKGGVGDHLGYSIFVGLVGASLFLGGVTTALRDADPQAIAEVAASEQPPRVQAAKGVSYWPAVMAFGVAVVVLGLVFDEMLTIFGLIIVGFTVLEWAVNSWTSRATGDPALNRRLRNRLMYPIEIPAFAFLGAVIFVAAFSRILLAVSENGSLVIFALIPTIVLIIAFLLAARPAMTKPVLALLIVLGAGVVIVGGIVGLVHGPRPKEKKGGNEVHYVPKSLGAIDPGAPVVVRVRS